jgi:protein-tyrosine phosphatase
MFSIFKKKEPATTDFGWLHTDIHSHLVPGIDDGAQDMVSSLELVRGLVNMGFASLVTTPHIFWELYPNTPEIITAGSAELQQQLEQEKIRIPFKAAAEYFIDEHFDAELKAKKPLLTIKDNLVLVEFSMLTQPFDLQELLFEMQLQGYQPLIAHPERYVYLRNNKGFFDELKNAGCQFQLNLMSITGHYGKGVQELAAYLIQKEAYDYAGTDLHSARHLQVLQTVSTSPLYAPLRESGMLKNHLL